MSGRAEREQTIRRQQQDRHRTQHCREQLQAALSCEYASRSS
jgi:hypothetical protein